MNLSSWLAYQVFGSKTKTREPRRRTHRRRRPDQADAYRAWIREQPSVVSGLTRRIEAAHTGPHAYSQKSSGYTCIPLTLEEHAELHRIGPRRFEEKYGISFAVVTEALFTEWSDMQARRRGRVA